MITLLPDAESASVLVTVTTTRSSVALYRTDQNGRQLVRLLPGQTVTGGALIVRDYEPALVGQITYSAHGLSASTFLDRGEHRVSRDWASVVARPQYNATADVIPAISRTVGTGSIVHNVIGRSDAPVTLQPSGPASGTVTIVTRSREEAQAFEDLHSLGKAVLFRFAAHESQTVYRDFYAVTTTYDATPDPVNSLPRPHHVTLGYTEVRRPAGALLGALGWTYDAVVALGVTYDDLPEQYATYNDLTAGVPRV